MSLNLGIGDWYFCQSLKLGGLEVKTVDTQTRISMKERYFPRIFRGYTINISPEDMKEFNGYDTYRISFCSCIFRGKAKIVVNDRLKPGECGVSPSLAKDFGLTEKDKITIFERPHQAMYNDSRRRFKSA